MMHYGRVRRWLLTYRLTKDAIRVSKMLQPARCKNYSLMDLETSYKNASQASLYVLALAYCFIGLSAITARFFQSMEHVVKQTRRIVHIDPSTHSELVRHEKVWNYALADIALLAFGTSFPQISLATIDAIQNVGQLCAGGLGPGTLVGSAAFDLFPIHAVCVVVPRATSLKKISDVGLWLIELFWSFWAYVWLYIILEVWTPNVVTLQEACLTVSQYVLLLLHAYAQDKRLPYISLPLSRAERPTEWVPEESSEYDIPETLEVGAGQDRNIVDIFSIHSQLDTGSAYHNVAVSDMAEPSGHILVREALPRDIDVLSIWGQQFLDVLKLGCNKSRKRNTHFLWMVKILWQLILVPWRFLFAFVPPYHIAHGWIAFIFSLIFISGIAYVVTRLTDMLSSVTGINPYIIAFTVLASGTSWPDLVASKIAAERQETADSAIANITCSNAVNIYVGIGIPWLIDTIYNFAVYKEPLCIKNAAGLSFSLLIFFATSMCCIAVLVLRRLILGAELGGSRLWAWITCAYFMFLWVVFIVLSSLKVSGII